MYKVGDFCFEIKNHDHIPIPKNLSKFKVENEEVNYIYDLYVKDTIEIEENSFILEKDTIKIYADSHLQKRYIFFTGDNTPCACSQKEVGKNHTIIYVNALYVPFFQMETVFVSTLSLEKRLYPYEQFIFHSASIVLQGKTLLFTAPSGGGKSTQASLWEKYRNVSIVNGDRSLLVKKEDGFYTYGWPICGTSKICNNEQYPLLCIVVVQKDKENFVEELDYKTKVKTLISEMTINYHNIDFIQKAMDFIEQLASHTVMYRLHCTISEDAVTCLEERLTQDKLL